MYHKDKTLPTLPLPEVRESLQRLHKTLLPFNSAVPLDSLLAQADSLADAQKLLAHRRATQANWLGDWWDEFAYLRARYPVVINSNIMAVRLIDMDPNTWKANPLFSNPAHRAALCITESLHFRGLMIGEAVKELLSVSKPLCMNQFRRYYGMRLPSREKDSCVFPDPREATHAVIMYKGRLGAIKVADAKDVLATLTFPELAACVKQFIEGIDAKAAAHKDKGADWWNGQCIGALTAADRDTAADGFALLSAASPRNRQNLHLVYHQCLTIISIDDEPVWDVTQGLVTSAHGSPHNRWFDRATSQIIASNGVGMYQGEHSPMDAIVSATTPIELVSLFGVQYFNEKRFEAKGQTLRPMFNPKEFVHELEFSVPEPCQAIIKRTIKAHNDFAATCEVCGFRFTGYGRAFLGSKKVGADFVVQAALQMALLADSGTCAAVYESASTRMFQEGRTDTIRAYSVEQKAFVEAMHSASVSSLASSAATVQSLAKLFVAAMKRHAELSAEASTGHGVDRHLLGLRVACGGLGKDLPPFFSQPEVQAAGNFTLLTSQMIGTTYLGGFAHSLPYGYGCCYYIHAHQVMIVISCNSVEKKTSVERFSRHLTTAFEKIGALVKGFPDAKPAVPKSSL
jgi:hypothetical protein